MEVLLIDDSSTSRLYTRQALAHTLPGISIHEVASGQEARQWLLFNNADLIISDLEMEHGDGVEFVQWLRSQTAFAQTRVLVHSAHVDLMVRAALNRHQPIAYLPKPAGAAELDAALKALWVAGAEPALA